MIGYILCSKTTNWFSTNKKQAAEYAHLNLKNTNIKPAIFKYSFSCAQDIPRIEASRSKIKLLQNLRKMEKTDVSENDPIVGYFHGVSPIKTSRKNTRYFNATVQTARQECHQAVFFTPEKYNSIVTAQKNKTPVKLNNARKKIGKYNLIEK